MQYKNYSGYTIIIAKYYYKKHLKLLKKKRAKLELNYNITKNGRKL